MKNIITSTPKRPYIIAPSEQQKQRMVENIDRSCSLYYITMGSVYNVCQSAMIDARDYIKTHDAVFYKHQVKYNIKQALVAYDKWNKTMYNTLGEHYQMWLDVSDSVDEELKPLVLTLYYTIDNFLLKHNVPHSKTFARFETARILLDFTKMMYCSLFDKIQQRIGVDIRGLFKAGDAADMFHFWDEAMRYAYKIQPVVPNVDLNTDAATRQAVENITRRLTNENIYNRSGEYALRLNPDQWRTLDKETRMRLKKGLPISE